MLQVCHVQAPHGRVGYAAQGLLTVGSLGHVLGHDCQLSQNSGRRYHLHAI